MWQTLRDNPEVLWGFLLALGVVLVLTPAVGRFARILGVVDQPGEGRRMHVRPIPRLGGIALLLGIFVPALAFMKLDGPYRGILLGAMPTGMNWYYWLERRDYSMAPPVRRSHDLVVTT